MRLLGLLPKQQTWRHLSINLKDTDIGKYLLVYDIERISQCVLLPLCKWFSNNRSYLNFRKPFAAKIRLVLSFWRYNIFWVPWMQPWPGSNLAPQPARLRLWNVGDWNKSVRSGVFGARPITSWNSLLKVHAASSLRARPIYEYTTLLPYPSYYNLETSVTIFISLFTVIRRPLVYCKRCILGRMWVCMNVGMSIPLSQIRFKMREQSLEDQIFTHNILLFF